MKNYLWLVIVSIVFAGMRIGGLKGQSFQAFAHLWVGFLIAAAIYNKGKRLKFILSAVFLTIVEVACAILL